MGCFMWVFVCENELFLFVLFFEYFIFVEEIILLGEVGFEDSGFGVF